MAERRYDPKLLRDEAEIRAGLLKQGFDIDAFLTERRIGFAPGVLRHYRDAAKFYAENDFALTYKLIERTVRWEHGPFRDRSFFAPDGAVAFMAQGAARMFAEMGKNGWCFTGDQRRTLLTAWGLTDEQADTPASALKQTVEERRPQE